MAGKSPIEWTEHTWNPIVGCTIVSPGCTNCYAMKMAARIEKMHAGLVVKGSGGAAHYLGTTKSVKGNSVWTGKLALAPEIILNEPLRRKKPTTYFVNSMGDLFHEDCPDEWIDQVFARMALAPQHTFQILTKRAERMRRYLGPFDQRRADSLGRKVIKLGYDGPLECLPWPLPNVWLGVSAERQQEADKRIPELLATPAAVRFVSCEPLLGLVDLASIKVPRSYGSFLFDALRGVGRTWHDEPFTNSLDGRRLDWAIVGGESGANARPCSTEAVRLLRDQCEAAGVAFFLKQWGEWLPVDSGHPGLAGPGFGQFDHCRTNSPGNATHVRIGKKAAGRLLDGVEHNGFPNTQTAPADAGSQTDHHPSLDQCGNVEQGPCAGSAGAVTSSRGGRS